MKRARPLGRDRRFGRVEAHKDTILALIEETPDIGIEELRQTLADKGVTVGFFARHTIAKKRRTRPSRTAPTS